MVNTRGVSLVALALFLAGFAASCSLGDSPSIEDIPVSAPTTKARTESEPSGLADPVQSSRQSSPASVSTETVPPAAESPTATAISEPTATATVGNVYARGNGRVILRNTTVLGDQITQDNGEIIVE